MKRINRRRQMIVICLSLIFMSLFATANAATKRLKLAHVAPVNSAYDIAANKFAELVERNSEGTIKIKIYPNSQFGNLPEHNAQLKTGAFDLLVQEISTAFFLEPPPKNFLCVAFPYVLESQTHFRKFLESDLFGQMMNKVETASNVKYLGYFGDRVPRGFSTTNKRVETPDDIKGLKLRVPNAPTFVAAFKAWGAAPTPVSPADLYSSVKSGMIVGLELDLDGFISDKYYEIQKYYVQVDYMNSGLGIWMNAKNWAKLDKSQQAILSKSVDETSYFVDAAAAKVMRHADEVLAEHGVELIKPDRDLWLKPVAEAAKAMDGKMWEAGLYDKIQALK